MQYERKLRVVVPPARLGALELAVEDRVSHAVIVDDGRWGLAASAIGVHLLLRAIAAETAFLRAADLLVSALLSLAVLEHATAEVREIQSLLTS